MMRTGTYSDNVLYQLAQTLADGGRHSTAAVLRLLVQAGYTTLGEVDTASDWVLLSIRGIGVRRLTEVRQLTRTDWQPPSAQAIHAANWFLSSVQFALRYWPPETLAALIRGSEPRIVNGAPIEKRLAIDVLSQAARKALHHCQADELVRALQQAGNGQDYLSSAGHRSWYGFAESAEAPAKRQDGAPTPSTDWSSCQHGTGRDNDHFAFSLDKRREIVQQYRAARESGQVINKDSWADKNYGISGRTLLRYEREYERAEMGVQ